MPPRCPPRTLMRRPSIGHPSLNDWQDLSRDISGRDLVPDLGEVGLVIAVDLLLCSLVDPSQVDERLPYLWRHCPGPFPDMLDGPLHVALAVRSSNRGGRCL